jgi:hypothetical protein
VQGKLVWKFYPIANDGDPGGDTWGNLPNLFRAGGDSWITGSYDPELNLTYWGGRKQSRECLPAASPEMELPPAPIPPWHGTPIRGSWSGITIMLRVRYSI